MKKKLLFDNSGFMLVEVIIVTVVVATIMVSLYVAFNRVYDVFELKAKYTNVDAIYAIKTVEDYFMDNMKFNDLIKNANTSPIKVTCDMNCDSEKCFINDDTKTNDSFDRCKDIFTTYRINSLYLIKLIKNVENKKVLPDLSSLSVNQTFKDYFDYMGNAVTLENDSSHIFLIETYEYGTETDGNRDILNKYAYLEVK